MKRNQMPGRRECWAHTKLSCLPAAWGPDGRPPPLRPIRVLPGAGRDAFDVSPGSVAVFLRDTCTIGFVQVAERIGSAPGSKTLRTIAAKSELAECIVQFRLLLDVSLGSPFFQPLPAIDELLQIFLAPAELVEQVLIDFSLGELFFEAIEHQIGLLPCVVEVWVVAWQGIGIWTFATPRLTARLAACLGGAGTRRTRGIRRRRISILAIGRRLLRPLTLAGRRAALALLGSSRIVRWAFACFARRVAACLTCLPLAGLLGDAAARLRWLVFARTAFARCIGLLTGPFLSFAGTIARLFSLRIGLLLPLRLPGR